MNINEIVYTNGTNKPLTVEEVIDALVITGEKILISNGNVTTQISWASNGMLELITIKNDSKRVWNHIFMQFNGIDTIKFIRIETYKYCDFYYGYFKE